MKKVVRRFVVPALVAAVPVVFAAGQQSGPQQPHPLPPIVQPNPLPPIIPNTGGPVDPTPTQPPPTGN